MPLAKASFASYFAHCRAGAWGRDHRGAIERCQRLLERDLSALQKARVQRRLDALRVQSTSPNERAASCRASLPSYVIKYESMHITDKSSEWIIRRALTEIHQKLAMNSSIVRRAKAACRTSDGKFVCRRCTKRVKHLTVAHMGQPMRSILQRLVVEAGRNLGDLFSEVIQAHRDASFAIVCSECNADLECSRSSA